MKYDTKQILRPGLHNSCLLSGSLCLFIAASFLPFSVFFSSSSCLVYSTDRIMGKINLGHVLASDHIIKLPIISMLGIDYHVVYNQNYYFIKIRKVQGWQW